MPKRKRPSRKQSDGLSNATPTHPRPLNQRERTLIQLYSYCQLGMTPQQFYAKWQVTQEELALICSRSIYTVQRWFQSGRYHPHPNDLRHLALMDFLKRAFRINS